VAFKIELVMVALLGACARDALADETASTPKDVAEVETVAPRGTILAPKNALELQFNAGYTQPFGPVGGNVDFSNVARAGFGSGGALAFRLTPHFAFAGYGSFHQSVPDERLGGMAYGMAGGLSASYHALPYRLVDPVVTLGTGYRLLFISPAGPADNHMFHGFELLKAEGSVDFRIPKDFALGPMLGADVNLFLWDLNEGTGMNNPLAMKGVSTFFFAGVAGKLDVLGKRIAARPEGTAQTRTVLSSE
jgi:hypothetical protein